MNYLPSSFKTANNGAAPIPPHMFAKHANAPVTTGVKVSAMAKVLLMATLAVASTKPVTTQPSVSIVKNNSATNQNGSVSAISEIQVSKPKGIGEISKMVQKDLGFKTANWAAILKVERKTLYNWEKNPETKVQSKIAQRVHTIMSLRDEMDQEHRPFFAKYVFNNHYESGFLAELTKEELDYEKLISLYDRNYSEIDGLYKRHLHSQA
ncbi:hypothetical protein [Pantoea agglomerans]|uniref:hypothetical protein n=1 Tax=Enterobacter agglomerans TaxID=549 RepID=UPI001303CAA0|nr:hypothetical protein [Pantoea agglomerans]